MTFVFDYIIIHNHPSLFTENIEIEKNIKKKDDEKNNPKKSASGESSSDGSDTMIVKFASPTGQQVSGQFNKNDAESL
jgi:hypothetical protein